MTARLLRVEQDIIVPVKGIFLVFLLYHQVIHELFSPVTISESVVSNVVAGGLIVFLLFNLAGTICLFSKTQLSVIDLVRIISALRFLDGTFLGALILLTGGFESLLFWGMTGLVVINGVTIPAGPRQIILNGLMILSYYGACHLQRLIRTRDIGFVGSAPGPFLSQPMTVQIAFMLVLSFAFALPYYLPRLGRWCFEKQPFPATADGSAAGQIQVRGTSHIAQTLALQLQQPLDRINTTALQIKESMPAGRPAEIQKIQMIQEEVERSQRIIDAMRSYGNWEEKSLEMICLKPVLDEVITEMFPTGIPGGIHIERHVDPELPRLAMHRNHLRIVLLNLLQNACEATQGNGHLKATATQNNQGEVIVIIEDDGPGIPIAFQAKIFEPFYTTKPNRPGLGLSIVKHNVELYGGSVSLESASSKGARFVIRFRGKTVEHKC